MSWILNWNSLIFRSILYIIFFLDLILLFYGLYINNNGAENGEKTIKSITDTITNAVALGSIGGTTKSGKFH